MAVTPPRDAGGQGPFGVSGQGDGQSEDGYGASRVPAVVAMASDLPFELSHGFPPVFPTTRRDVPLPHRRPPGRDCRPRSPLPWRERPSCGVDWDMSRLGHRTRSDGFGGGHVLVSGAGPRCRLATPSATAVCRENVQVVAVACHRRRPGTGVRSRPGGCAQRHGAARALVTAWTGAAARSGGLCPARSALLAVVGGGGQGTARRRLCGSRAPGG